MVCFIPFVIQANKLYCLILGSTKRISNNDVVNYLMQQTQKQQLLTMSVENLFPYIGFTEENLREYYENPPSGMKIISIFYVTNAINLIH